MSKPFLIDFNLHSDISRLIDDYEAELSYHNHMIEKLRGNSYKSDNSKEILQFSLKRDHLELAVNKLKAFIYE